MTTRLLDNIDDAIRALNQQTDDDFEIIQVRRCPLGQMHSRNTGRCIKAPKPGEVLNPVTQRKFKN